MFKIISNHTSSSLVVSLFIINCLLCGRVKAEPITIEDEVKFAELENYAAENKDGLPVLDDHSALDDYLVYAALNSPDLRAAFEEWRAALFKIPQARSLPDPKFNFAWFIREVETRVGPQEQKIGLSQLFPWFGKLDLREDMAVENANALKEKYESKKLRLFYDVKNLYYEYYYLFRSIDITEKNMKLLTNLEVVARSKYRAGDTLSAMVQAQVELGKLEDQLNTLKDLKEPLALKFNAILDRPLTADLPRPRSVVITPISINEDDLFEFLATTNPELKKLDYQKAREHASIRLAKKDFYPDFMFGLETVVTDDAINSTSDSGKDPVIAMFSINIPIWRNKYKAAQLEAESRYSAVDHVQINRKNELLANTKMAHYHFRDAERKVDLFKDTLLPKAQQSLNVLQKSYEAGKTDFLNLIDAERLLLEFELSHERAVANRMQRLAEIEMLVGRSITPKE